MSIPKITLKDLKKLQERLRSVNLKWVEVLVERIKKYAETEEGKQFEDVNEKKIYNVFNGIVVDQAWVMIVVEKGLEIVQEEEAKSKDLKDQLKQIA